MNQKIRRELEAELRRRRSALLQSVAGGDEDLRAVAEERESELEESAQKERLARLASSLKERDRRNLAGIDAALKRMAAGVYGKCERCGEDIGIGRLRALPMASLCIECASEKEKRQAANLPEEEPEPWERLRPAGDFEMAELEE
ncbi:MAG TPA: TraR/DksA family transcriptional regulator [Candidatus Acidoferrales bacterium]|nr:TraR/DksA family transcriptional regulator [Candidatus Acidoferrales bacterium]